ncbi:hypothetical protein NQ314_009897 [Rhamnusium bicolor]|uniref:Uncharacterized protein n=1 Tax=Rhamnusium bicolor TaxID=1586634 RepID=A0AAV8XWS5_9CUCU|nr:hypothetical protein NQ314_009897 [Rhamnusium bicolor]
MRYTSEEIKWYGYSFSEACKLLQKQIDAENKIIPLKQIYRSQLIEKLRAANLDDSSESTIPKIGYV